MTLFTFLFLGLLLGMKHAIEADHLAAVATLVTGNKTVGQAVRHGVAWGIGHTLTLSLFAGAVLAFGTRMPEPVARWLELAVGVMLVALGADVLIRLARQRVHFHVHTHEDGIEHFHAHSHAGEGPHALSPHRHPHRPLLPLRAATVGMMHGMAGSAALVILSLEAVQSPATGILYIALFGIGSMAGMAILSAVIAIPLRYSANRLNRLHGVLTVVVGATSCLLGGGIICRQVVISGLS